MINFLKAFAKILTQNDDKNVDTIYDAIQSSVFGKNIELVEQIMQDNYSSTVELNKDQNIMTQVLQAVANIPSNDALYAYSQIIFVRYRYMMKY